MSVEAVSQTHLTERFARAMYYAYELHAGHRRKARPVPYLAHLLAVTGTVLQYGGSEDEAIAALLHDAVEDQGGAATREAILARFGETVTAIVDGCTDTDEVPKPPWRVRKEAFLERLRSASPSIHLVTAADKLHNVRSVIEDFRTLGDALWDCFTGGKEGTLWYYRSVVAILQEEAGSPLVDELARALEELERVVTEG